MLNLLRLIKVHISGVLILQKKLDYDNMYEVCEPDSFNTKFETTVLGMSGCLLNLEIMRGRESIKNQLFNETHDHCT